MTKKEANSMIMEAIRDEVVELATVTYKDCTIMPIPDSVSSNYWFEIVEVTCRIDDAVRRNMRLRHEDISSVIAEIDWAYDVNARLKEKIRDLKEAFVEEQYETRSNPYNERWKKTQE